MDLLLDLINTDHGTVLDATHVSFGNPVVSVVSHNGRTTNTAITATFNLPTIANPVRTLRYSRLDLATLFVEYTRPIEKGEMTRTHELLPLLGEIRGHALQAEDFVDAPLPTDGPLTLQAHPNSKVFIGEMSFFIGTPAPRRIRLIHRGGEVTV